MISRLGRRCMEFSHETYILIVRHVATRADLASLCRVSRGLRRAAERLLYNTLSLKDYDTSISLCEILFTIPRLAFLFEALSVYVSEIGSDSEGSPIPLPENYWNHVALALKKLHRLRFLNIYIEGANDGLQAWVLADTPFQLRTFHCDFEWDEHLSAFLVSQSQLSDLYISDFKINAPDSPSLSLDPHSLPRLATLECTFMEAASSMVPGRPVTRLKTCFSASQVDEKRAEMRTLFTNIRRSRRHLRSLDIADASYTQDFSLELLTMAVNTFSSSNHLRYLGTLVLPVGGRDVCYPSPPTFSPRPFLTLFRSLFSD